jgi:hypothetical protein
MLGVWRRATAHRLPEPKTWNPAPIQMALACTGRGPLAVPPGLMRTVGSPLRHGHVSRGQDGVERRHKKTLARQGRELLAVPPWLTLPHGASTLSALSCATPSSATEFCLHKGRQDRSHQPLRGEFWLLVAPGHTNPRLSEQRGNRTGPRQRVQYALVARQCTGDAGPLSTRSGHRCLPFAACGELREATAQGRLIWSSVSCV